MHINHKLKTMKKQLLNIAFGLLGFSLSGQVPFNMPTNGLVAYYPFDNSYNDVSVNSYHATNNGTTFTFDRNNNSTSALFFNGTSAYVDLPYTTPYNSEFNSINFTVGAWVKLGSSNVALSFFKQNSSGAFFRWGTPFPSSPPQLFGYADRYSANDFKCGTNGTIINDNGWHFVVMSISPSVVFTPSCKFYIDGTLFSNIVYDFAYAVRQIAQVSIGNQFIDTDASIVGGSTYYSFYDGLMDDFFYYDRVLTDCEVYNMYKGFTGVTANLPNITSQPSNAILNQGLPATFIVSTNTYSTTETYTWQESTGGAFTNISSSNSSYSGVNTKTLTIVNTINSMNGYAYRCVITNGSCTSNTFHATLYLSTVSLIENGLDARFSIYPNPSNDYITIKGTDIASFAVTNLMGQTVISGNEIKNNTVNISELNHGVYFIIITDVKGKKGVKKIIKQ